MPGNKSFLSRLMRRGDYAAESLSKDAAMRLEKLRDQKGARMKF